MGQSVPSAHSARLHLAEGHKITRAMFEENFALKMEDPGFLDDISPLLSGDYVWVPGAEAPIVSA